MKHITIVEDEDYMREELSDILRKAGYETEEIKAKMERIHPIRANKPRRQC